MQLLNINGTDVEVMSYGWSKKEQDVDSGINLKGYLERDILEHHRHTLKFIIPPQNQQERQAFLNLVDNPYLTVKLFSPKSGREETHTMYHGDLDSDIYWNVQSINGDDEIRYTEVQVDLVEY